MEKTPLLSAYDEKEYDTINNNILKGDNSIIVKKNAHELLRLRCAIIDVRLK